MGIGTGTIAAIGLGTSLLGTAAGVYGQVQAASAASGAAKYNQQIEQQNSQIANNNAVQAGQAGEAQAGAAQQKTRAEAGAIKANQAASNVDVNSGSAVDVQSSASELGELNAITVRGNAAKQAYSYETQAAGYQDQSNLSGAQAESASTAGEIGATSTFLGGLGSAGSNWAKYQTQASPMSAPEGSESWANNTQSNY
jgi:hypothetical protein